MNMHSKGCDCKIEKAWLTSEFIFCGLALAKSLKTNYNLLYAVSWCFIFVFIRRYSVIILPLF